MTEQRSVSVGVRGRPPVGGGSSTRWEWRRALADQARVVRKAEGLADVPVDATFEVHVSFSLSSRRLLGADLDNLVRPVLNTLFQSRDEQADPTLTATLVNAEDARIYELHVRKREVTDPADEGVGVVVRWTADGGGS